MNDKRAERYIDQKLECTYYTLTENETIDIVLSRYQEGKICFIQKTLLKNYTQKISLCYNNSAGAGKTITISDRNNKIIAFQKIDFNTGVPDLESTEKCSYNEHGDQVYF